MGKPPVAVTGHGDGASVSLDTIFIDTNLGTHLAMNVSSSDTVADLKQKIPEDHLLCFPNFGEVKIDGLQVKKRGLYYQLAESMVVRSVFEKVKKGWFVTVEASIVSEDNEVEPEEANLPLEGRGKESNGPVEVSGGTEPAGRDDRGDKVLSRVPFVSNEFHIEEKCDEEEAPEMEVERAENEKELGNIDANSSLPDRAFDVKKKRKKRKRSKQGAGDLSGKDINFLSQVANEFQEPITDEMNKLETEREVPETVSTILQKEPADIILPEVDPSVDHGKTSKKRRKAKKHKKLISGTVPVLSDADRVRDYSATDFLSSEPENVGKAENSIHEAAGKGDVKEAMTADSVRASLLLTGKEIDDVTKNGVESADLIMKSEAVAENKEGKSRKKKIEKHGSDGTNSGLPTQAEEKCTEENLPARSTVNIHGTDSSRFPSDADLPNPCFKDSLDRAEIRSLAEKVGGEAGNASKVDGVNFSSYFIPSEQNKKTADPSDVTGAGTKTKSKKKRKVQEGNLHDISTKLPGSLESNALICPSGSKPKKGIEHHHCENSTNTASHTKRGKKDQSESQQTGVNGGRGSHPGLNGTVRPESGVASRSLFKSSPLGDDSGDSLEVYHFPSPHNLQLRTSSPEAYSNRSVSSVLSDGESDAGFDSMKGNGSSGRKAMKTPLSLAIPVDTILKSTKRYKKAKLDAESQNEDSVPLSPSI